MVGKALHCAGLSLVLMASVLSAQSPPPKSDSAPSKSVKADSVTINMPEGMTKDQADAILNELRQIRQLLQNQQAAAAQPKPALAQAAVPSDKVKMTVGKGWYALGREDAPVTMVEFADYQCPFCRRFETESFAQLKKNYIDTGKVRFVSRDLPWSSIPMRREPRLRCVVQENKTSSGKCTKPSCRTAEPTWAPMQS